MTSEQTRRVGLFHAAHQALDLVAATFDIEAAQGSAEADAYGELVRDIIDRLAVLEAAADPMFS